MVIQFPGAAPAVAGLAGAASCPAGEERVVLRDGSVAVIRPLVAGDVAAIAAWFEGLGEETRYARFLAGVKRLDDRTRSQLAQVDHWDHEALTAVMPAVLSPGSLVTSGCRSPRRRRWRSP
jgi:hypothetical protein